MCEHKWGPWKQLEDRAIGDECGNFDRDQPFVRIEQRSCELCPAKEKRKTLYRHRCAQCGFAYNDLETFKIHECSPL
jgi:hypothetical protein